MPFDASTVSLSAEEVARVAADGAYNLVPVFVDVEADLETPVSAYLKLRGADGTNSFLLESVEGGERQARYSFIGSNPYRVLRQNGCDPLVEVERELHRFRVMPVAGLPDFSGGAVGYTGYDCVKYFEPTVEVPDADPLALPESVFLFCSSLVVFDHLKHTMKLVAHVRLDGEDRPAGGGDALAAWARRQYAAAVSGMEAAARRLGAKLAEEAGRAPADLARADEPPEEFTSNVGKDGYTSFVSELKTRIRAGDIIQAVPSQRLSRRLRHVRAFDVYRRLRVVNPSPYMFFLDFGDFEVVGASPEQLVRVDNGVVTTHPIAGTRPRGATEEEDERLAAELLACEKERAEHVMLVDLGRNDVGRVSEPGTVRVDSLMHIERYSHVMHIVSNVSGRLAADKTPYDAFRAVFPAGTLTGAPKIRAMQLVAGLEKQRRGIYGGAVGYIGFGAGALLDTCIAIRTMVVKDGSAYLQAGGGIVFDSEEEAEHQETVNKMMALARAIDQAEEAAVREARLFESDPDSGERDAVMKNYELPLSKIEGNFGRFGGRYVPETLVAALDELEREYVRAMNDPSFREELRALQKAYVGRPTPVYLAKRLSEHCGGARIWLKREDLAHTGAHKINNGLGQGLLAKRMGKKRIICETGAGQHGVATATACALLGLQCVVYMGAEDVERQALNVFRIKMLGGTVVPVESGTRTLKDAVNEAMRDWVANVRDTFFLIGSAIGPHPFPTIVRDFQCCLGEEVRRQMVEAAGRLPDVAVACVGGGSNAIGLFHPLHDSKVELFGVEAAGRGVHSGEHAATISGGSPGVLHGTRTMLLQSESGQVIGTHSISAGLDYPGIGPEHAHYADSGRVKYVPVTDTEALEGMQVLTQLEGIIPALEPSHAVYWAMHKAASMRKDQDLLINLCGRGDKDMAQVMSMIDMDKKVGDKLEQKARDKAAAASE